LALEFSRYKDHVHLSYVLEAPTKPGEVQHDLNIEKEGSYVLSVKNPDAPTPPDVPHLKEPYKAELPPDMKKEVSRFMVIQ
jgi:hypothetical protein